MMARTKTKSEPVQVNTVLTHEAEKILTGFTAALPEAKRERFRQEAAMLARGINGQRIAVWKIGGRLEYAQRMLGRERFLEFLSKFVKITEVSANRYRTLYHAWPKRPDYLEVVTRLEDAGQDSMKNIYAEARRIINERDDKTSQTRTPRGGALSAVKRFVKAFDQQTLDKIKPDDAVALRLELEGAQQIITTALDSLPAVTWRNRSRAGRTKKAA